MGAVPVWVWLPGGVEPVQAGVIRDANPAGYGADRLDAQAGRALTALELLEHGVPDGVGAIEVCTDIETKLAWLRETAALVAGHWEPMLRDAAWPVMNDLARLDALVADARAAFAYGEWLASQTEMLKGADPPAGSR
jgi:hypothetical protein